MDYRVARKLHNGDEVIVRCTREGRLNVSATVLRSTDHKERRTIELELLMPGGNLDVYTHMEVT